MGPVANNHSNVYLSSSRNSVHNLALEEYLMSSVVGDEGILFLYENEPSIVIGRFQNPWKECRTGLASRNGTAVLRRISGGGTVVHSPGNLNFSVIADSASPEKEGNLDRVIRALARIGVRADRNDRHDLVIRIPDGDDGSIYKFSGSAFRQTSGRSMHHATLLVNADLIELRTYLHNPSRDMEVRAVVSNPSPVANLCDAVPGLNVSDVASALAREWGAEEGPVSINPSDFYESQIFREASTKLESDKWTWGKTPPFRERFSRLPGLGDRIVEIVIRDGRISGMTLTGDAIEGFSILSGNLLGCLYHGQDIITAAGTMLPAWLKQMAAIVDGDERAPA
jgi:lipoate-protein ligase A